MQIHLDSERLARAKRAFTTRNVPASVLHSVTAAFTPRAGDLVLARVVEVGAHKQVELPTSRKATLFAGDEVILAYGNRYAPDQFEAYVPDDLDLCDLAAGGGIEAVSLKLAHHLAGEVVVRIANRYEAYVLAHGAERLTPAGIRGEQRRAYGLGDRLRQPWAGDDRMRRQRIGPGDDA